jgi:hypothetical protein
MESRQSKTIVYDSNCPVCTWYTAAFVKYGVLKPTERISFNELDEQALCRLDIRRARHEIPLIDNSNGRVLYGLDGLMLIIAQIFPLLGGLITKAWFKKLLKPLYSFISYNRRVLAGSAADYGKGINSAPDFSLSWRLALIVTGMSYTAFCIFIFAELMAISLVPLYGFVTLYFVLLVIFNLSANHSRVQKWDYLAHLAVLGFIEGSIFVISALLAQLSGLLGLMFAGQGAGRLIAFRMHAERVEQNNYSNILNYVFGIGAVCLVIVIAVLKTI